MEVEPRTQTKNEELTTERRDKPEHVIPSNMTQDKYKVPAHRPPPGRLRPEEKVEDTLSYWKFQQLLKSAVPSSDNRTKADNENSRMTTKNTTATSPSKSSSSSSIMTNRQRRKYGAINSYLEDSKGRSLLASSGSQPTGITTRLMDDDHELWKLIYEHRWECAMERLQTHPHEAAQRLLSVEESHRSPPPPSSSSSKLQEERRDQGGRNGVNIILPLHLACSTRPVPPSSIIKSLIDAYPNATTTPSTDGYLPIHYAANLQRSSTSNDVVGANDDNGDVLAPGEHHDPMNDQNHTDMIRLLLRARPASICSPTETSERLTPLHIAAATARSVNAVLSAGHAGTFNLMLSSSTDSIDNKEPLSLATIKDSTGHTPIDYAWQQVEVLIDQHNDGRRKISVPKKYIHPLLKQEIEQCLLIYPNDIPRNEIEGKTRCNSTKTKSKLYSKSWRTPSSSSSPPFLPVPELRSTNDYLELRLRILQDKLKMYLSDDDCDAREGNYEKPKSRNDDDDDDCGR